MVWIGLSDGEYKTGVSICQYIQSLVSLCPFSWLRPRHTSGTGPEKDDVELHDNLEAGNLAGGRSELTKSLVPSSDGVTA